MLWNPPIWAGTVVPSWRRQAALALAAALAEAGLGAWLREIPGLAEAPPDRICSWIGILGLGLACRVVLSWRRDLVREKAAAEAGIEFHRRLWKASERPPVLADNSWLSREGRHWIENGTRAAAEMRTAIATMAILIPLLVWLAPWLALAVVVCAAALGWASQKRSRAGKGIAEAESAESSTDADAEDWAWRAMPEAAGSGIGGAVAEQAIRRGLSHSERRLTRTDSLLAWGAFGEACAHIGGWALAAVSLAAWKLGWLPAGNLAAFLGASLLAYRPVREAGRHLPQLQKADRIWERLRRLEERHEQARQTEPATEFVLEGFDAGWDLSAPSFRGVALRIPSGAVVVAHGPNGCGKSTLLAAIAGNCPSRSGVACIPTTRRWMAQEPVLPPLPPSEWIADAPEEAIELLFPHGLPRNLDGNAPIPRGGQELSRGERARLALLSVAAHPCGIWLLDEPLSALPADQRGRILAGLLSLRGSASVILAEPTVPEGLEVVRVLWEPAWGDPGPRVVEVRAP